MKKLDKNKKFLLATGVAALIIAVVVVCMLITPSDNTKPVDNAKTGVSSEESSLSPGEAIYDENDGTIHDSILVYEVIKDAKTPQMKVSSYYDINKEKMEIPSKVTYEGKEYTVTSIEKSAFESNTAMEEVIIADTIKKIGDNAFYSCMVLEKVVLSDSVTKIGAGAFAECSELKTVKFGKGLKSIGDEAFCDAVALTEITIPGSVESMGKSVFYGCENMTKCTFEEGVSAVAAETFTNCYKLEEVVLPESVVSIGNEAFYSCEGLEELVLPSKIAVCGERAFYSSGITKLSIKSPILQPGGEMLEGCDTIKSILVPESMVDSYKDAYKDEGIEVKSL